MGHARYGELKKTGERVPSARPQSGIAGLAADKRPSLDATPVAALPVSVIGFKGEARFDDKVHGGFILKANVNGVILTGGKKFNVVQRLALGFFKAVEAAAFITANGGFTAPGDDGFGQRRESLLFAGFAGRLRAAGRAFTFKSSHVASFGRRCG
jgi:hypothetical protein